jgi:hypothetical protein
VVMRCVSESLRAAKVSSIVNAEGSCIPSSSSIQTWLGMCRAPAVVDGTTKTRFSLSIASLRSRTRTGRGLRSGRS